MAVRQTLVPTEGREIATSTPLVYMQVLIGMYNVLCCHFLKPLKGTNLKISVAETL